MMSPESNPLSVVLSLSSFFFLTSFDRVFVDRRARVLPLEFVGAFLSSPHACFVFFVIVAASDTVVATPEADRVAASCWEMTRVLLTYMCVDASRRAGCADCVVMWEVT